MFREDRKYGEDILRGQALSSRGLRVAQLRLPFVPRIFSNSLTPVLSSFGYNYRGVPTRVGNLPELAMVTNPAASRIQGRTALLGKLGPARFWSLVALLGVLAMCVAFSWTTRDALVHLPFLKGHETRHDVAAVNQTNIVDLHPWQIAQALTPLAVSSEEEEYAHEAERLADHEVNQAFAAALRQAGAQHLAPTGEALNLSQKVAQLQQMAKEDQAHVRSLTAASGTTANAGSEDDLKIAQAQLDLDVDELNDAQQDLARASVDVRARIQQELAAHQAAMSKMNAQPGSGSQLAVLSTRQYATLAGSLEAWTSQRSRYQLVKQALLQAKADAASLTVQHNALEALADASAADAKVKSSRPNAATLAGLQRRRDQRQLLSLYDDRIQTQQQLAGVYSKWADQVLLQHRMATHMSLRSLATVAFILICVIVCEAAGTHLLERHAFDRRRMQTLRTILRLSVQLVGVLCVLLVTFGVPSQISTIVGLATAGLTVALQSFILAFFGWFILMGKNGMRVGDWVQINGVAGEVVEINLFRTTILETSNWADKGHPTGRRATFINNFAVTGQFSNFSTVGQWMWDEISVSIPASIETYDKVALIQQAVLEETQQDAQLAEEEWKRVPRKNGMSQLNAGSSVNMRPAGSGVDILIRYVTRAADRLEVRNRLYERVIEVLHKPQVVITSSQPSKLTTAVLAAADSTEHEPRDKRATMYT
jgi:small-conductance mechanosensitive channel